MNQHKRWTTLVRDQNCFVCSPLTQYAKLAAHSLVNAHISAIHDCRRHGTEILMDLMDPGFAAGQQCFGLAVICLPSLICCPKSFNLLRVLLCFLSCCPSPQCRSCAPLCNACLVSDVQVVRLVLLALSCSTLQAHLNASVKVGKFRNHNATCCCTSFPRLQLLEVYCTG